ncbi:diguanylate cyclase response regulator [Thiosulfatimonas sediminis]|uniref:diguanylate cyclase n=1 Tax=Thiosulfatimonas sediminis TaxID=2675054 RepID=A0A6F8PS96_9GAMM|nr:diguanylate cyclase [Thiosulfatimonas sediminis]BBP44860.1 diguanylate cyclase response regulator [Thiosulfatimonas sediminis]
MTQSIFLIIDDQKSIAQVLKQKLSEQSHLPIKICNSLAETEMLLATGIKIEVALCDQNLPDAPRGETIHYLLQKHIPTVVFSASFYDPKNSDNQSKKIADFVMKDSPAALDYAVSIMLSLSQNPQRKVWLLSSNQSNYSQKLINMLNLQRYQVSTFEKPQKIQEQLSKERPSIILIEDSNNLHQSEVYHFIEEVRKDYNKNQLPMMICESSEHIYSAIKMMKYGVNDFFNTSFTAEEFYVRLKQNIELSLSYQAIEHISQRDGLTQVLNRRYFFELAEKKFTQLQRNDTQFFVIMADIDHFKNVNDNHGHHKGDEAIIYLAEQLESHFSDYLVGRFGGEEFCVFGALSNQAVLAQQCEQLRTTIEQTTQERLGVHFTLSLGLCSTGTTISEAFSNADSALYRSKNAGRNQLTLC